MTDRINNLVKQMSDVDKKHLFEKIKDDYCLKEKNGMLRDDISLKIRELLEIEHTWLRSTVEEDTLEELDLYQADITLLVVTMIKEFELEEIEFSTIMEWTTVKDIVDYIEDTLECALYDVKKDES